MLALHPDRPGYGGVVNLPNGRLLRRGVGGPRALEELIIGAREDAFSGFFKMTSGRGRDRSEGALVFQDGEGMLANYRDAEDEVEGSTALPYLLEMANDPRTDIEARSFAYKSSTVDVDQLVRLFPEAQVRDNELDPKVLYTAAIEAPRRTRSPSDEEDVLEIPMEDVDEEVIARGMALEHRVNELEALKETLTTENKELKRLNRENEELRNEIKSIKDGSLSMVQFMQSRSDLTVDETSPRSAEMLALQQLRFEEWKDLRVAEHLAAEKKEMEEQREDLEQRRMAIGSLEAHLEDTRIDLQESIERFEREKEELNTVWKKLGQETQSLMESEQSLDGRTKDIFKRERDLIQGETAVREREEDVESKLREVQRVRDEQERQRRSMYDRGKELDNKELQLVERERGLESLTNEQMGVEDGLDRRSADLDAREALLDEREEGTKAAEDGTKRREDELLELGSELDLK